MYTHDITRHLFYNIYKYMHTFYFFNLRNFFEIVIFCNYIHTKLENYSCNSIHIYVIYIMQ